MAVKKWIFQILIGIDQLANTIAGGYADETLSSRAHRMRQKGQTYWRWTAEFIDMLFFWQEMLPSLMIFQTRPSVAVTFLVS